MAIHKALALIWISIPVLHWMMDLYKLVQFEKNYLEIHTFGALPGCGDVPWYVDYLFFNSLFFKRSKKLSLSASSFKMLFLSMPLTIILCNAPGASILDLRGIYLLWPKLFDLSIYQGTLYIKTSKGYTSESTYGIAEKNDLSHSHKITSW